MKQKFRVIIEETISDEFEIEAASQKEAVNCAIKQYKTGVFVLSPGNLEQHKISLIDKTGQPTEWIEF